MLPTTSTLASGLSEQMSDFVAYNLWANTRLLEWLQSKPAQLLDAPIASSFAGIRATLIHIHNVERQWLSYLQPAIMADKRASQAFASTAEIMQELLQVSEAFLQQTDSFSEEDMLRDRFCSIPYVGDHMIKTCDIIQHMINHSTYHRGQLITIGHHLGFTDAPMSDYMFYHLVVKRRCVTA